MGQGPASRRVGVSRTQACHRFPCPGTQETPLPAVFWGQRVSLRYKCAVCLQLKFVVVFFCPNWLVRGTRGSLCCHLMHGSWVTVCCPLPSMGTFPASQPVLASPQSGRPSSSSGLASRVGPCRAGASCDSGRDLFWRVSVGVSGASLAILRLHPRISVYRAGGPQVPAPSPTPGAPRPHTRSPHTAQLPPFTDRAGACASRARRPATPPRGRVISARRPPHPAPPRAQQWIS